MSDQASFVGKPGDAHQLLLDILGLHPSSVEFHSRYAESLSELYNLANLDGGGPDFSDALLAIAIQAAGDRAAPAARLHRRAAAGHPPALLLPGSGSGRERGRRPAALGDERDPRLHRRRSQLHPVARRRRRRVARRRRRRGRLHRRRLAADAALPVPAPRADARLLRHELPAPPQRRASSPATSSRR